MTNGRWGHCQHCRHFGSPARAPLVGEEAACLQPDLARYHLTVFASNGCTLFDLRPGLAEQIEDPPSIVSAPA